MFTILDELEIWFTLQSLKTVIVLVKLIFHSTTLPNILRHFIFSTKFVHPWETPIFFP